MAASLIQGGTGANENGVPLAGDRCESQGRAGLWITIGVILVVAAPTLFLSYLPMTDLAQHLAVVSILEHLDDPVAALRELKRVLKPAGTVTCIEGDHGSCFWHPETPESIEAWNGLIIAQRKQGHDPNIGRRLMPLLTESGFDVRSCEPAWLYADRLKPGLRDGMVNHIIVPMVQSAEKQILDENLVHKDIYTKGIVDLSRVDEIEEGTFFYTWFKAVAKKWKI